MPHNTGCGVEKWMDPSLWTWGRTPSVLILRGLWFLWTLVVAAPWWEKLSHFLLHTCRSVTCRETSAWAAGCYRLLLSHTGLWQISSTCSFVALHACKIASLNCLVISVEVVAIASLKRPRWSWWDGSYDKGGLFWMHSNRFLATYWTCAISSLWAAIFLLFICVFMLSILK